MASDEGLALRALVGKPHMNISSILSITTPTARAPAHRRVPPTLYSLALDAAATRVSEAAAAAVAGRSAGPTSPRTYERVADLLPPRPAANLLSAVYATHRLCPQVLQAFANIPRDAARYLAGGGAGVDASADGTADLTPDVSDLRPYATAIMDDWMAPLAALPLRELNLAHARRLTDEALFDLADRYRTLFRTLRKLNLSHAADAVTPATVLAIAAFPKLEVLNLAHCDSGVTNVALANLARGAAARVLRELRLERCEKVSGAGIAALVEGTRANLRVLDLAGCTKLTGQAVAPLRNMAHLTELRLRGCGRMSNEGLACVAEVTTLEILDLYGCAKVTDEGIAGLAPLRRLRYLCLAETGITGDAFLDGSLADAWTDLEALHLSRCRHVTPEGLVALFGHFDRARVPLRELKLRSVQCVDRVVFAAICRSLPQLRLLDLSDCRRIQDDCVFADPEAGDPAFSSSLTDLDLGGTLLSDTGIAALLSPLKKLQSLSLNDCTGVGDTVVAVIATNLPRLSRLDLSRCERVSDAGLEMLAANGPSLTDLTLDHCSGICGEWIHTAAPSWSRLDRVSLRGLLIHACDIDFLARNWRTVRTLSLRDVVCGEGHPRLSLWNAVEDLDVSGCAFVTDDVCGHIAKLEHIRSLNVSNCDMISESGVRKVLAARHRIHTLNLRGCPRVAADAVMDAVIELAASDGSVGYALADNTNGLIVDMPSTRLRQPVDNLGGLMLRPSSASMTESMYEPYGMGTSDAQSISELASLEEWLTGNGSSGSVGSPRSWTPSSAGSSGRRRRRRRSERHGPTPIPVQPLSIPLHFGSSPA